VDPPLTLKQIEQVAEGVARSGKRLAFVYITHGHPDHWFGTATLLERFGDGDSVVYATEGTIRRMHEELKGKDAGFHVVAGHKNKNLPDDPKIIDETRQYLRDAIRLLAGKPTPQGFFDEMMKLHGDRLNPGPLWYGGLGLLA
jgi:glyoxylase-like metal-dependent hydrolase (beta-lactamase superfamily II)